jgi:hypothetical protein
VSAQQRQCGSQSLSGASGARLDQNARDCGLQLLVQMHPVQGAKTETGDAKPGGLRGNVSQYGVMDDGELREHPIEQTDAYVS